MTRFCIRCNRIIGEKCVQCGTQVTASSNGHAVNSADFDCPSCGHHFPQGDGGETGGMCERALTLNCRRRTSRRPRSDSRTQVWDWQPGNRYPADDPSEWRSNSVLAAARILFLSMSQSLSLAI